MAKAIKKSKSFFDSLWFNLVMSVVAVVVLVESVIERKYVYVVLWIILLYHFVREVVRDRK